MKPSRLNLNAYAKLNKSVYSENMKNALHMKLLKKRPVRRKKKHVLKLNVYNVKRLRQNNAKLD